MRPSDDAYIMVEDEFHATARAFTQHLHHAEYQRLKQSLAQRLPPHHHLPIARAVDSITEMRAETKKRREVQAREARNREAVKALGGRRRAGSEKEEEEEDDDDEGEEGDQWKGTELHRLMAKRPDGRNQTSLVGLHTIPSALKAKTKAEAKAQPSNRERRISSPPPASPPSQPPSSPSASSTSSSRSSILAAPRRSHARFRKTENERGEKRGGMKTDEIPVFLLA